MVVDVQVLVRRGVEKDERTIAIERVEIDRLAKDRDDEKNILENNYKQNLISLFRNKTSNVSLDAITKGNKIQIRTASYKQPNTNLERTKNMRLAGREYRLTLTLNRPIQK